MFSRIKRKISKLFFKIVKKTEDADIFFCSRDRVLYLFTRSGVFSKTNLTFGKNFFLKFATKLFYRFGISTKLVSFYCNSIFFLLRFYNLKFDFRILRISLF